VSKKRDPILAVFNFFQNADLAQAVQALALAKEIVARRQPQTKKPAAAKKPPNRRLVEQPGDAVPV